MWGRSGLFRFFETGGQADRRTGGRVVLYFGTTEHYEVLQLPTGGRSYIVI